MKMPNMTKLVNIDAKIPVRNIDPPVYGKCERVVMTTGDILKCLLRRATIHEILPDGSTVKLTTQNYFTDNGAGLDASANVDLSTVKVYGKKNITMTEFMNKMAERAENLKNLGKPGTGNGNKFFEEVLKKHGKPEEEETPVEEAPVEETVEEPAPEEAPAEEVVEEAPVEEPVVDETPAPVEEAPVEETAEEPAPEEAPVEEAPKVASSTRKKSTSKKKTTSK